MRQELTTYNKKRNFTNTTEPKGEKTSSKGELKFVVQKHAASRLHYDFRLELNGVLVSWAVPKQPSFNPNTKRLAIKVEDHPFDYRTFEGNIPKGNYGAGTVMVWDQGTYYAYKAQSRQESEKALAAGLKAGNIKIFLEGKKLKGLFSVIRTNKEEDQWILFKIDDEYASKKEITDQHSVITGRTMEEIKEDKKSKTWHGKVKVDPELLKGAKKAAMPKEVRPMLATLVDEPFNSPEWLFEIKYDGYRALAQAEGKNVRLYSRNNKTFNEKYSEVVESLQTLPFKALLDGEVVMLNEKGLSDFQALQNSETEAGNLFYFVFDILWYDGKDLRHLPLVTRKEILRQALPEIHNIKYCAHIHEKGIDFFDASAKLGLEGMIAKKGQSVYESSSRSKSWVKIKISHQQEAIICGYTPPKGSRSSIGALLLGAYDKNKIKYIGKVGTGFKEKDLKYIKNLLDPLNVKTPPAENFAPAERQIQWVKPQVICQVKYSEITKEGVMRHPSFLGLREDKAPKEVHPDKPQPVEKIVKEAVPEKVKITNPKKVYWPDEGYKKMDVVNYYKAIAPVILPYLKDRPQSLYRTPEGIVKKGFFQKNVEGKVPEWVETKRIFSESNQEDIEYMLCQNEETLLFMANWGCVEINPWNSTIHHLDNPDWAVFDLDPVDIPFEKVVEVALEIRKVLDDIEVESFIKTSGADGIHIYVPLGAKYTYDQSQQFVKLIEMKVHARLPAITSLERMPSKRKKKVYLDFLQNAKGKTMASVYALRPKPGAPVSTPLKWKEVNKKLNPLQFNIKNMPKRIDKLGDLWSGFLKQELDMMAALEKLENIG